MLKKLNSSLNIIYFFKVNTKPIQVNNGLDPVYVACLTSSPATRLLQRCTNQVPRTRDKQMDFVDSPDFQAQGETPAAAGKCPLHSHDPCRRTQGQSAPNLVK